MSEPKPAVFDEREGNYFVIPYDRRRYGSHDQAVELATNAIAKGSGDEFLIVQVIGRVKKCAPPVEYVPVED